VLAVALLAILLAADVASVIGSATLLPPMVASHFDGAGVARGYTARIPFLLIMGGLGIGIPIVLLLVLVALPCALPRRLRIPSRDYWTAPERLRDTLSFIASAGLVMACIGAAFMLAMHWLVVMANLRSPPRLDNVAFYGLIAVFMAAILMWQLVMWRRFQAAR
jgi:hypothetical protein